MNLYAKVISYACIAFMTITSTMAMSSTQICATEETADDYVVGYFNGVNNSEAITDISLAFLAKIYGKKHNDLTIKYEPFYNHTGSEVDSNVGQDLVEVFRQRADEIDATGALSNRLDIFHAMVTNDSNGLLDDLFNVFGATGALTTGLMQDLYTDLSNEVLASVGELFYNPPSMSDYTIQSSRIASLSSQGSRMLYVAHSQGNLFANVAYDYTLGLSNMSASNVGLVHVAPATTRTNGTHILADKDIVINSLRLTGTVPENTVVIPISHLADDPSGHGFIDTYLQNTLDTRDKVISAYDHLLNTLEAPEKIAEIGAFTATLTWNGDGDVDLHTYEPLGDHVYYRDKTGSAGYLDLDNTYSNGPEHYYTSCENSDSMLGTFNFAVNNYNRASGKTATIQISTPDVANVLTRSLTLGDAEGAAGNDNPETLITVTVASSGNGLTLTAQ